MGFTYVPPRPGLGARRSTNLSTRAGGGRGARARARGSARRASSRRTSRVIVRGTAQLFVAGPPVVRGGDGRDARQGGARRRAHADRGGRGRQRGRRRGRRARAAPALPLLPARQRVGGAAGRRRATDPPDRREEELLSIVPRERAPARTRCARILEAVLDRGSVFEVGARFGRSLITALARLDGRPVGVLASDPKHYGGGLTADASEKLARFVDLCDQFHLPVVNFVDQPGFVIGTEAERAGTIRRGARALVRRLPGDACRGCSVLVRKVYGVAGAGHGDAPRLNLRYAWPSRRLGLAADRGRPRGRLPARARGGRGPGGAARRDRGAAQRRALAVPHRRALRRRGDHRPARHAPAAVRLGRARARAGRATSSARARRRAGCGPSRAGHGTPWTARPRRPRRGRARRGPGPT